MEKRLSSIVTGYSSRASKAGAAVAYLSLKVEARMMPRAADAVADHEPLRKRPVIMAAMRVDGENLKPGTYQQNILIADVTEQGLAAELI